MFINYPKKYRHFAFLSVVHLACSQINHLYIQIICAYTFKGTDSLLYTIQPDSVQKLAKQARVYTIYKFISFKYRHVYSYNKITVVAALKHEPRSAPFKHEVGNNLNTGVFECLK